MYTPWELPPPVRVPKNEVIVGGPELKPNGVHASRLAYRSRAGPNISPLVSPVLFELKAPAIGYWATSSHLPSIRDLYLFSFPEGSLYFPA